MELKEISQKEFENYVKTNSLSNYMQTIEYAKFMEEYKYEYKLFGLYNNLNLIGASLILIKKIGLNLKYGYAPKGFLLNYYDETTLKTFTSLLKEQFSKENITFVKINPEIIVGEINAKTNELTITQNAILRKKLEEFELSKLKDNLYFESINPRFNAFMDLKNTKIENYTKLNRNKVRNAKRKGLFLEKVSLANIDDAFKYFDTDKNISYYKRFIKAFENLNCLDLFFVKINYENFLKNSQNLYNDELAKNNLFNEVLHRSTKGNDLNKKMMSDALLCSLKNEIINATEGLRQQNENEILASVLTLRFGNRVHIIAKGIDITKKTFNAKYFMIDELANYYKQNFDFLDIGGVSGDFKKDSPYRSLNRFVMGFNPRIFEYIGEFDLIINKNNYNYLIQSGKLAKELNKK